MSQRREKQTKNSSVHTFRIKKKSRTEQAWCSTSRSGGGGLGIYWQNGWFYGTWDRRHEFDEPPKVQDTDSLRLRSCVISESLRQTNCVMSADQKHRNCSLIVQDKENALSLTVYLVFLISECITRRPLRGKHQARTVCSQ